MNQVVEEWIRKAENDYATACREIVVSENPNYEAVCFHAQQCIEKLLKALIIQAGDLPPKIHDLYRLSCLVQALFPDWSWQTGELNYLSRSAVDFRYPGEVAEYEEARKALDICTQIRMTLLGLLRNEGKST
jgi:HEPN domain-containing protein